jgi:hypothetical protein
MNRTCIVGAKLSGLSLMQQGGGGWAVLDNVGNVAIVEGQTITLDGTTGRILNGPVSADALFMS